MSLLTPSDSSQGGGKNMKIIHFSNEFPNTNLVDVLRDLHYRSKGRTHLVLALFLEGVINVLNEEVATLDPKLNSLVPPFEVLSQIAENESLLDGPLGITPRTPVAHAEDTDVKSIQSFYEDHPGEYNFEFGTSFVTGLGVGLIASAALALSPCLGDIPLAGVESVRLAFRLGVVVDEVSQNIEPRDLMGHSETWAYVLTGVTKETVQTELDKLYLDEPSPRSCQIFISGIAGSSVTITGPPSRLKALFRTSEFFGSLNHVALPVYGGLCHAGHIYGQSHLDAAVRTAPLQLLESKSPTILPILSTSTGKSYRSAGPIDLYEQLATELLTNPITWSNVVSEAVRIADNMEAWGCQITFSRESHSVRELLSTFSERLPDFKTTVQETMPSVHQSNDDQASRGSLQSKIAIVGMACRYPGGADNTEKFWNVLEQGLDVHRKVPIDRFDADLHTDPTGKRMNTSVTPYGCFIDDPGLFDAQFFNMSPREAEQTDPMQRLALVTAYEAMERAGYVANRTRSTNLKRTSVFYGQSSDDYREANVSPEIGTYFIPGGNRAFHSGRINYFFKFAGPSFNCDTACSSSLSTIQIACTSLWAGDTDMVIAGGMNLLSNSDSYAGLSAGHFLSKTGSSKTWDAEADGYCRADGIGTVVLKRLEDAEADNDNILGVILAAATNHSAEAISITHPHAGAQADLYRQVMHRAGVSPLDVSFVELHGTGTQAGDFVEIESITDVFAPNQGQKRRSSQPLHIGAVKSNVGHGEAAAGVTALMKVLCMMEKNAIPPHVGIKNSINPLFPTDFDKRNLHIPFKQATWTRQPGQKRVAVVNNFSAAGGNTTLALEDAPFRQPLMADPRTKHVIAVSAKHKASLQGNVQRLLTFLNTHHSASISDLSYTTCARRQHFDYRVAIAASSISEARDLLMPYLEPKAKDSFQLIPKADQTSVAFVFTGQGTTTQVKTKLYQEVPYFRAQIDNLNHIAQIQGFPSIIPAIDEYEGGLERLSPVVTQLALVCLEIALARYWISMGVKPSVVLGHSLGEYAALHIAGVFSANDAIFLAGSRARLLQRSCSPGSHTMLAIRGTLADIAATAAKAGGVSYHVACVNGEYDIVVSGTRSDIESLSAILKNDGLKCHILDVPFAFHSPQVDAVLDAYENIAKKGIIFKAPEMPIISPLLGKVVFDEKTVDANYMRRATREPVNFVAALRAAEDMGIVDANTIFIENGPHQVCCNFVQNILGNVKLAVPSMSKNEDAWATLAKSMSKLHCGGVEIDWNEFNRPFEKGLTLLDLPTYAWNNKNYWVPYKGAWNLTKIVNSVSALAARQESSIRTSSVQRVIDEEFSDETARLVMRSDVMHPEFLEAANGHRMNGCGVVTSSIHVDLIYTLANYFRKQLNWDESIANINILNLKVTKGLVAFHDKAKQQIFEVRANMDPNSNKLELEWYNIQEDEDEIGDRFATASVEYEPASIWLKEWSRISHLVFGRIEALERMAEQGKANRISRSMAYRLFANLVDYHEKYQGMKSVILDGFEAVADIELDQKVTGKWTVPPHFLDSVSHIAGFVMNGSDAMDTSNYYCVTPGFESVRIAKPLVPGGKYRSYVKMIPSVEDPAAYFGDVYIFEGQEIIGMVGSIQFNRYPRILLSRFFSAPDDPKTILAPPARHEPKPAAKPEFRPAPKPTPVIPLPQPKPQVISPQPTKTILPAPTAPPVVKETPKAEPKPSPIEIPPPQTAAPFEGDTSTTARALALIGNEAGLEVEELRDEASFAELGVDSLMSLVIAEKFREQLNVVVQGSLFLEYPTVGHLKTWLKDYYD